MTDNHDLHVEVRGGEIPVTMPRTTLRVVYGKPHREPTLIAKLNYFPEEQKGPITRAEFLAKGWRAANEKARELGWIAS
jgi:hypothetical protein